MRASPILALLLAGCHLLLPVAGLEDRPASGAADHAVTPDSTADRTSSCVATLAAGLDTPLGLALDRDGSVLVAESGGHRIRRVGQDGTTSPVAGSGVPDYLDASPATAGRLKSPSDVAVGPSGIILIADTGNHVIRKLENGALRTHAGSNDPGSREGPVYTAMFHSPTGIAVDGWGVLYVADTDNDRIRVVNVGSVGSLPSTVARPRAVALDGVASVFAVQDHRVVRLEGHSLVAVAGDTQPGDLPGAAESARFSSPRGLVVSSDGIYLADRDNHCIRRVAAGQATTIAGGGSAGAVDGSLAAARFDRPSGLALDPSGGRLFVTDSGSGRIRIIRCGLR